MPPNTSPPPTLTSLNFLRGKNGRIDRGSILAVHNLKFLQRNIEKMAKLLNGQTIYGRHGREYKIQFVDFINAAEKDKTEGWEIQAQIDRKRRIIKMRRDLHPEDKLLYLLHELIHDLVEDFETYDLTDEFYITLFTGELYDCLKRNKLRFYGGKV